MAQGEFPKVDGDILYASEVNDKLTVHYTSGVISTGGNTTDVYVNVGSTVLTGLQSGAILNFNYKATLFVSGSTGHNVYGRVSISGANTGEYAPIISTPYESSNFLSFAKQNTEFTQAFTDGIFKYSFTSGTTGSNPIEVTLAANIPVLDGSIVINNFTKSDIVDQTAQLSGVSYNLTYAGLFTNP